MSRPCIKGDVVKDGLAFDFVDDQQTFMASSLLPYGGRIATATDPMVKLPFLRRWSPSMR
jgi:hypothetical protein